MRQAANTFIGSFKRFVGTHSKNVVFISVFYALWIALKLVENADFTLQHFKGRMLGNATLNGYDIQARVSLFYNSVAVFVLCILIFHLLAFYLSRLRFKLILSTEFRILNYSSAAGILYYLFRLFGFIEDNSLELIYLLHKILILALFLRLLLKIQKEISVEVYSILLTLSASLYFVVADLSLFSGTQKMPDFFTVVFVLAILFISVQYFLQKKLSSPINDLLRQLSPLAFAPFISVLKDEIFLIFKFKGITVSQPLIFILLWIIVFAAAGIYRKLKKTNHKKTSVIHLLSRFYFPAFIFSIVSYIYYSQFMLMESVQDMFEPANRYLAIMEFQKFGVIPLLEKNNSHLLSDIFFTWIYSLFSELKTNDAELYDFFLSSLMALLYYYLLLFITRSPYFAIAAILFYPFYGAVCPYEHVVAVLAIFALIKITEKVQTVRSYAAFFFILAFIILWRIDAGFACVLTVPFILLFLHFNSPSFRINFKSLLKGLAISLSVVLVVVSVFCLIRGKNLFAKVPYVLNYFSSAQTYGFPSTGDANSLAYKMHYFVFPVTVICILLYFLFKRKSLTISRHQRYAYISVLVLCAYYLANFQRGLVRHSLAEGIDTLTSSFVYLIFIGTAFLGLNGKKSYLRYIFLVILLFLIPLLFRMPSVNGSMSLAETGFSKLRKPPVNSDTLESRTYSVFKGDSKLNDKKDLIRFLKTNLKSDETFIDFTNRPMLFFYTQKETPSYFFQNPLCSHNDYLQDKFISDLKDYKLPYLIFENVTDANGMDDVPNNLRHYRMAEYFYRNYSPDTIIDEAVVWRNNKTVKKNTDSLALAVAQRYQEFELKMIPYIWGTYDKTYKDEKTILSQKQEISLTSIPSTLFSFNSVAKGNGNTLILTLQNYSETDQLVQVKIFGNRDQALTLYKFTAVKSQKMEQYALRISFAYNWYHPELSSITVSTDHDNSVKIVGAKLTKGN